MFKTTIFVIICVFVLMGCKKHKANSEDKNNRIAYRERMRARLMGTKMSALSIGLKHRGVCKVTQVNQGDGAVFLLLKCNPELVLMVVAPRKMFKTYGKKYMRKLVELSLIFIHINVGSLSRVGNLIGDRVNVVNGQVYNFMSFIVNK